MDARLLPGRRLSSEQGRVLAATRLPRRGPSPYTGPCDRYPSRAKRPLNDAWLVALARKGAQHFDALLEADRIWLSLVPQVDDLRSRTKLKGKPTPEQVEEELKTVKGELQRAEEELAAAAVKRESLLAEVPNPPDASSPDGFTDDDAVELRRVGDPPTFTFEPRGPPRGRLDRHGTRRPRLGLALCLPHGRRRPGRTRALSLRARPARLAWVRSGAPARPRPRRGDVRNRIPADGRGEHLSGRAR